MQVAGVTPLLSPARENLFNFDSVIAQRESSDISEFLSGFIRTASVWRM
jgi:hypothetical protein